MGESANVDLVCYDKVEHSEILGAIAEGNSCLESMKERTETKVVVEPPAWYRSPWLWFAVGMVVSGATVGYIVTR